MKTFAVLVITILSIPPTLSFSQTEIVQFSPEQEIYGNNYLHGYSSGRGDAGIAGENGLSGILLNPAGFTLDKKYELNFQYTVKTTQPWNNFFYANSQFAFRQNWFFSGYAAFGYKINKNFTAGFVYNNPASYLFYEGEVTGLYGESYDTYTRFHIHSFMIPFSYSSEKFSFGASIIFNQYVSHYYGLITTIQNPDGSQSDAADYANRFNAQIGAIYKPSPLFSVGITVTPGFKADVKTDFSYPPAQIKFIAKYPWRGGLGFAYQLPRSNVKLYADYNYVNTGIIDGYKDRHNFNIGMDYYASKYLTIRGGLFTFLIRGENTAHTYWIDPPSRMNQVFFTAGATYKFKNSDITASLMDSHFGGDRYTNTYLNISYSVGF
jgi:hypothetical protein